MHVRYEWKTEEAPGRKSSDLAWGLMGAQISLYSAPAEDMAIVASILIVLYKMLHCFAFCLLLHSCCCRLQGEWCPQIIDGSQKGMQGLRRLLYLKTGS